MDVSPLVWGLTSAVIIGLLAFAEKGRNNPQSRGTNKVTTICEGQYRTLSYVDDHAPVVVDEPLHLEPLDEG